jgi:hypothetical protein
MRELPKSTLGYPTRTEIENFLRKEGFCQIGDGCFERYVKDGFVILGRETVKIVPCSVEGDRFRYRIRIYRLSKRCQSFSCHDIFMNLAGLCAVRHTRHGDVSSVIMRRDTSFSNFRKIKQMNVDELADFLANNTLCGKKGCNNSCPPDRCRLAIKTFLLQEPT